jgi:hypothetical protein
MATYQLSDGRTVSTDMPFTLNGIQYPSNWLTLSSPEDRKELGIEGPLPEPAWYDQRWAWGYDGQGKLIWKDHAPLVVEYVGHVRRNANAILVNSDWLVVREVDNGIPVPSEWRTWREAIRLAAGSKIYEIEHTADTPALAAYITGPDYPAWPSDPSVPTEPASSDGMGFTGNVVSSGF